MARSTSLTQSTTNLHSKLIRSPVDAYNEIASRLSGLRTLARPQVCMYAIRYGVVLIWHSRGQGGAGKIGVGCYGIEHVSRWHPPLNTGLTRAVI